MKLGSQVKKLRKTLRLTQKEFVDRIPGRKGNSTYLGKIERGESVPSLKFLQRIAIAYSVPTTYFFLEGEREAEELDRYCDVALKVKEAVRSWMLSNLPTFVGELKKEIEQAMQEALAGVQKQCLDSGRETEEEP